MAMSAGVEYLFPPFPGDSVTIVGAVLIPTAGWPWWGVFLAVMVGSSAGAMADFALGRWLSGRQGQPGRVGEWLARPSVASRIEAITEKFERHGAWYLALNRFLPAFRSLFFIAAGLAGLPTRSVVLWSAVSAALWNGVLMLVGYAVGYNLEALVMVVERYTWGALIVVTAIVGAWLFLSRSGGRTTR